MKRFTSVLALVALGIFAQPGWAASDKLMADGIPVILKTNAGSTMVSVSLALRGGIPYYGAEQAGIELAMANASRKGSLHYPKEKLQSVLARTGASISVDAQADYTTISLSCLRRDLDETWDVFADVIVNPTFDPAEVALVKERQLGDVKQSKDDADTYLRTMADELHYASQPYAVQPMGTEESVGRIDAAALKAYHDKSVNKARSVVVIVGDVDKATAEKLVKKGLAALPAGSYTEPSPGKNPEAEIADTRLEKRELPTNYVRGYYTAPPPTDPDYVALTVATRILRDRLFEEVRTKRNMTYAVSAGLASRRDNYGMLYVTAVEPDTTLRVMLNEVHKMQTEKISEKELHDQLKVMVTQYLMDRETNASQAAELCRFELVGSGFKEADLMVEQMRKVTQDDIQRVCQKYMKGLDFVMLGDPAKWKDPLAADKAVKPGSGSLN